MQTLPSASYNPDTETNASALPPTAPSKSPVLPTLPRTTNLMGPDSHAREFAKTYGNLSEDHVFRSALNVQRSIVEGLQRLESVRQTRNPSETAGQHLDKVGQAYNTLLRTMANRHDMARSSIRSRMEAVDLELADALGMRQSQDSSEIRQVLRGMDAKQRAAAIQQAIEDKDGAVLHAIFNGRELTTGISETQKRSFRRQAEQAYAPELCNIRHALEAADKLVTASFSDLEGLSDHAVAAPAVRSEFERQVEQYDAAWLEFNRAVQ